MQYSLSCVCSVESNDEHIDNKLRKIIPIFIFFQPIQEDIANLREIIDHINHDYKLIERRSFDRLAELEQTLMAEIKTRYALIIIRVICSQNTMNSLRNG